MKEEILKNSLKVSQNQILLNNKLVTPKILASQSKAYYGKRYLKLKVPQHQYDWLENLLFQHHQAGLLSPRDHGKTTIIPRVASEQITLFDKKENILLLSKTHSQAKKTLDTIHDDLTKNPLIQADFKQELSDYRKVGNQIFFNMPDVLEDNKRDAKIEANGILGDITGGHFTKILMDDIFDDENTRTSSGIATIMKFINGTVLPLLEPDGQILFIATHKHYNDGYNQLKNNPSWNIITQKAILEWPKSWDYVHDDTGTIVDVKNIKGNSKVLWPEKWPIDKLLLKKAAMGSLLFNREYQNETKQLLGKLLKDSWLNYYVINPDKANSNLKAMPPLETMDIYQGIDVAIGTKAKNDYFVITTKGVTRDPYRKYTLDWYIDKIPFPKQVKIIEKNFHKPVNSYLIENEIEEWEVLKIGIESNAYQKALSEQVIEEFGFPVEEIYSTADKTTRITAGAVDYENDLEYIPLDHPNIEMFLKQYREFDEGEHEDILDSADICNRTIIKPDSSDVSVGMDYLDW